jgi:hypothetical protein
MPRVTQANALQFLKNKSRDELAKLFTDEGVVAEILNWAEQPVTKKVRGMFGRFEAGILKKLKSQEWTEAEARGMCHLLVYFGYLDKIIKAASDTFQKLETKKRQIQERTKEG